MTDAQRNQIGEAGQGMEGEKGWEGKREGGGLSAVGEDGRVQEAD